MLRVGACALLWVVLAVGCADGAPDGSQRQGISASRPAATRDVEAGSNGSVATPPDPKLVALLECSPTSADLEYLTETLLFTESESEFLTLMSLLSRSAAPDVAMLAADTVSTGFYVAAAGRIDLASAIEANLGSPSARMRRIVVRNLGQVDGPQVRAWLLARSQDDATDEMQAERRSVAEEAKLALLRLEEERIAGRSCTLGDDLSTIDVTTGSAPRAPIDRAFDLVVQVESVTQAVSSISGLREPFVTATFTIVPRGADMRIAVLRVENAPMYSGGFVTTANARLFIRCRALGRNRARVWYRAAVE